jgi:hypothetical protein
MQVSHSVYHIRLMGGQSFRYLFQFGEVIAEQIPFAERRQTLPEGERPQTRLLDDRLTLVPLHDRDDRAHEGDL